MPCGLVYAAVGLAVASGSPVTGALAMVSFGVGTLPVLVAMGAFAQLLSRLSRRLWVRRSAGIAMALCGLLNLATASAQAGWTAALTFGEVKPCCATPR
jgi:sulfite exporter TauE/SafE